MGIQRFPLVEDTLGFYVRQRADVDMNKIHKKVGVNAKTISADIGVISKWADLSGYPKVDQSWVSLKRTIHGYMKTIHQLKIGKRDPITAANLLAIIATMYDSTDDEMFVASWITAFR